MDHKTEARIAMCVGGILMGMVGLFVSALSFIPTYAIVSLRGLFASLILFMFLFGARRLYVLKYLFREVPGWTILQGLLSVSTVLSYFYSIQNAGYGYAAFMLYTGPIFAVFIVWGLFKKQPRKRDLLAFLIAIIGIAILTQFWVIDWVGTTSNASIGFLSGLFSGISLGFLSAMKIGLFEQLRKQSPTRMDSQILLEKDRVFTNLGMAAVSSSMLFLVFSGMSVEYYGQLEPIHWGIAILLGLFPTAIAFSLVNIGLQHDEAGDVLIFSYSEVIIGTLLTAFIDYQLTTNLIFGGCLIICSNLLILLQPKSTTKK